MSRVIVKNLPAKYSEERLKEVFSSCGNVTDIKLIKTKAGTFRRFGYVGFSRAEHACAAIQQYNKTYIGSAKIEVEEAKAYGDQSLSRPWSKYSTGSSAHSQREGVKTKINNSTEVSTTTSSAKKSQASQVLEQYEKLEEDPAFQEFVEVHKHKEKVKTWSDSMKPDDKKKEISDEIESDDNEDNEEQEMEEKAKEGIAMAPDTSDLDYLKSKVVKQCNEPVSDDVDPCISSCQSSDTEDDGDKDAMKKAKTTAVEGEEPVSAYTVKMLGLPFNIQQKDVEVFFHPLPVIDVRFTKDSEGRPSGRGYVDFQSEEDLKKALKRNKDCIRHRYIELFKDDPTFGRKESIDQTVSARPWEQAAGGTADTEVESIVESGRIFVRNLSYCTQEEELSQLFEEYGPLTEASIPLDKTTNTPTGMGFVTFMLPEHAAKAFQALDGQIFQGRLLHLLPARPRMSVSTTAHQQQYLQSSYKKKKDSKMKSNAQVGHNWNTLFLGANAVLDVMADKYATDKSVILDHGDGGGSAAVRLALGEVDIVRETREFLVQHGINLDAFEHGNSKRSKTVIVVKNLPSGTKDVEISALFKPFGQLLRVILPPASISAVVEFAEASHARQAFSKLAYTSFKHLPLYLEWAPANAVMEGTAAAAGVPDEDEDDSREDGHGTIFVKNLNFATSEEALKQLFSEVGEVTSVTIAKKKNPKDSTSLLSMGYGFVEFVSDDVAKEAVKVAQHKMLDGHMLELKFSHHKMSNLSSKLTKKTKAKKIPKSAKILVRNVPFEATIKEVRDLFSTFGALKTVRLPRKLLGSTGGGVGDHRGFCFVEFVAKEDAKKAFKTVSLSTHLYGRRLVLEWAEEDSLETIRKRTAEHFHGYQLPWDKKSKSEQSLLATLEHN